MVDYVRVDAVELLTVGIEWPAATGPVTITLEHLVDIMVAGNDDPHIRRARLKLGHSRLQPAEEGLRGLGDHDPTWDGDPAFGSVENLRLDNDGAVLLGDLVEVPDWMAEAIPSAWPNRSCEWTQDHTTEGGKRYSAVLTAVSLLGTVQHAITDLEDIRRLVVDGPDDIEESS